MSYIQRIKALVFVLLLACQSAQAAGGAGMATEFTQVMNNAELAAGVSQQIKTVLQLAQQYALQLQQFREQVLAGLPTGIAKTLSTVQGVRDELKRVSEYQRSLEAAGSSVAQLKNILSQRQAEAKIASLPFDQYIAAQAAKIEQGDKRARQRLANETTVMEQVDADLKFATEKSGEITGTAGVHQAVNLLNSQMNRMLLQNSRVLTLMAQAQGTQAAEKEAEQNVSRQAAKAFEEGVYSADKAAKEKAASDVNSFMRANPGPF